MKKVFTTGQVAKICKVAPRTVSKWFDTGRLRGYRIPGSQDRRIPREHLIRFLKEHGMPMGDLEDEAYQKILIVSGDRSLIEGLKTQLTADIAFRFETAASGFEAGIQAEAFHPDCILVDLGLGRSEGLQICQNLRRNPAYQKTILLAITSPEITNGDDLSQYGFTEAFTKPLETTTLAERIRTLVAQKKDIS